MSFTPPLMIGDSCTIIVSACEVIVASSFPLVGKLPRAPADDLLGLLQASELFRLLGFIEIVDVTLLGVKLIFLKCLRFYIIHICALATNKIHMLEKASRSILLTFSKMSFGELMCS